MMESVTDIEVQVHFRTDRAILISATGDEADAVWIPLSSCEVEMRTGGTAIVTLPEHLAIDRGLV